MKLNRVFLIAILCFIAILANAQLLVDSVQTNQIISIPPDSTVTKIALDTIPQEAVPVFTIDTTSQQLVIDSANTIDSTTISAVADSVFQDSTTVPPTISVDTLQTDSLVILDTLSPKDIIEQKPELTEVSLVVHVTDSLTKLPLKATIIMSTLNLKGKANGTGVSNSKGYFNFKLTPSSHFEITVMVPHYVPQTLEVDLTLVNNLSSIFILEFKLKEFQVGDVIQLPNINFVQGDFHLQRDAFSVLDKLCVLMQENPTLDIKLKGHTDNTGSPSMNLKLSQQRINEVRYYLLRKGIKLTRLKSEGYGGTKPLVPNNSPENMEKNRRVEFEVLKI